MMCNLAKRRWLSSIDCWERRGKKSPCTGLRRLKTVGFLFLLPFSTERGRDFEPGVRRSVNGTNICRRWLSKYEQKKDGRVDRFRTTVDCVEQLIEHTV